MIPAAVAVPAVASVVSSGIGAAGNLIGTGMTNKRMRAAQRRQQQYNLELMDKAQQYNIENFNMENAYNAPIAQRERMKQAGLNPNFVDGLSPVVGQMDSVSNGSGASGQVQPYDLSILGNLADSIATFASIKRDNKVADSQIKLNEANAKLADSSAYKADSEGAYYDTQNRKAQEVDIPYTDSQRRLNEMTITNMERQYGLDVRKVDSYTKEVEQRIKESQANITNMEELRSFVEEKLPHEIAVLDESAKKLAIDAVCNQILAHNDTLRVGIESKNAESNRISALANQQNANTNEANGKVMRALNSALITYYGKLGDQSDAQTNVLNGQSYYYDLQNRLQEELQKAGIPQAQANAILWKTIADKEYIQNKTFESQQEQRKFEDTYFFQLYKSALPFYGIFGSNK